MVDNTATAVSLDAASVLAAVTYIVNAGEITVTEKRELYLPGAL